MYSFYGGKQGRSYKLIAHYDSIYDMVKAFAQGGSYTDVNYDEYVIIDTIIRKNEKNNAENGIIYRRGYDFSQPFNPEGITLNTDYTITPNDLTDTDVTLSGESIGVVYDKGHTTGNLHATLKVPKYFNYQYKFISQNEVELIFDNGSFNYDGWNDDWQAFVQHPGAGAIYVGQIVGPEGDSPEVEIISWDEWHEYTSEGGEGFSEQSRGKIVIDPKPGYDPAAAGQDGYDTNGFHDEIQYGHCTIRDAQGNVTGAYLAFDIPYTIFNFQAASISPYDTRYGTYNSSTETWSYDNLISEDTDSIEHPYYKHFHILIPKGIHGRDIENLSIEEYGQDAEDKHLQYLTYRYRDYDAAENPQPSEYFQLAPYKVITKITPQYQSGEYYYTDDNGVIRQQIYNYPNGFKVSYTHGPADIFDYQMIEKVWYQKNVDTAHSLVKDHIYIRLSTGGLVDCGLIKQVDHIAKDVSDNEYYTYYNDGTTTHLPVSEIEKVAFNGDLFLIRFKNINEADVLQTYEYEGENWINLGTVVKGNHVLTNFPTLEDLEATYPDGLGADAATEGRAGWVVTVGPDANQTYTLYAFDYMTGNWYSIQELGSNNIKPEYSVLVSKATAGNPNLPIENVLLNDQGVWFVVTE